MLNVTPNSEPPETALLLKRHDRGHACHLRCHGSQRGEEVREQHACTPHAVPHAGCHWAVKMDSGQKRATPLCAYKYHSSEQHGAGSGGDRVLYRSVKPLWLITDCSAPALTVRSTGYFFLYLIRYLKRGVDWLLRATQTFYTPIYTSAQRLRAVPDQQGRAYSGELWRDRGYAKVKLNDAPTIAGRKLY